MTIDRRRFFAGAGLGAGLGAAGVLAGPQATATPVSPAMIGRSVLDFGVEANTERDQTRALQTALDEVSASGHPAFIPPGVYRAGKLAISAVTTIHGAPGLTVLHAIGLAPVFYANAPARLSLLGVTLNGGREGWQSGGQSQLIRAAGLLVHLDRCRFEDAYGDALSLDNCSGVIQHTDMRGISGAALRVAGASDLTINHCSVSDCSGGGILVAAKAPDKGVIISNSRVTQCGEAGIEVTGRAIVSANMIDGCAFGLRLGDAKGTSHILATQNSIANCRVGIACQAEGDYIFATLNMIQGSTDGAIRAIADGRLVGPDLIQRSAESYRNLAIAGNVAL